MKNLLSEQMLKNFEIFFPQKIFHSDANNITLEFPVEEKRIIRNRRIVVSNASCGTCLTTHPRIYPL
jgi:hypothetical protein